MATPTRLRLTIDPGPDFERWRARFSPGEVASRMAEAIRVGMDKANLISLSRIQRGRFTGTGPYPVSQQRLGHVSRRLIRSLGASRAVVRDAESLSVGSGIGSNVSYFGVHEFGFDGRVNVPAHSRRMPETERVSSAGRRYRVPAHVQSVRAHSRMMRVPARRPLQAGMEETQTAETYQSELYTALMDALTMQ